MFYPVRVYDPEGRLKKVHSSESLEDRSKKMIAIEAGSYRAHRPVKLYTCERCEGEFWSNGLNPRYCPSRLCGKGSKGAAKTRPCKECGKAFTPSHELRDFCNETCRDIRAEKVLAGCKARKSARRKKAGAAGKN